MMYDINEMDMIGFKNEEHAKAHAAEIMEMALEAGYDPSKKPFMFGDEEEEKKPEA